jgi:hypothetical protein
MEGPDTFDASDVVISGMLEEYNQQSIEATILDKYNA